MFTDNTNIINYADLIIKDLGCKHLHELPGLRNEVIVLLEQTLSDLARAAQVVALAKSRLEDGS